MKRLSKVIQRPKNENRVTVRVAATEVPLHICLETLDPVGSLDNYQDKLSVEVGDVLLCLDAP